MEILTDYKDLVGKKIVFSHMPRFAQEITLATEDGCVLMATFDYDDDEEEAKIRIMYPYSVVEVIKRNEWMRNELGALGIFDIETYKKEQEEKRLKEQEEAKRLIEERDRAEYERLKAKYEK